MFLEAVAQKLIFFVDKPIVKIIFIHQADWIIYFQKNATEK